MRRGSVARRCVLLVQLDSHRSRIECREEFLNRENSSTGCLRHDGVHLFVRENMEKDSTQCGRGRREGMAAGFGWCRRSRSSRVEEADGEVRRDSQWFD